MYNNYFPVTYPQAQPMSYPQYQSQNNGINWVQGIEGAKAYPVAPNATVMLMDSNANTFYIKNADATGRPTVTLYDFQERKVGNPSTEQNKTADFVTREELYAILNDFVKKGESDEQSVQTTESDG